MAKIYTDFQSSTLMSFGKSFSRLNGQPLDKSSIWYSLEEAQAYAATDAAYVGQIISVIDTGSNQVSAYVIKDSLGTLDSVGSATLGDDKSISLIDGVLSVKNFGVQYYAYDTKNEKYSEVPTQGFIAGLEPRVREVSTGVYEIAWYEPNPNTVEGLASAVSTLQSQVATVQSSISDVKTTVDNMYTNEQIDAAISQAVSEVPQWGTIPV